MLASTIVNELQSLSLSRRNFLVAYHFFDFSNDVSTKTDTCIRSIKSQLAQSPLAISYLESLREAYAPHSAPTPELLRLLKKMVQNLGITYVVLDALDVCSDKLEVLALLEGLKQWNIDDFHLLLTSRDEPDIKATVAPLTTACIDLRNDQVTSDIGTFVAIAVKQD